jgi:hypothetical protein
MALLMELLSGIVNAAGLIGVEKIHGAPGKKIQSREDHASTD